MRCTIISITSSLVLALAPTSQSLGGPKLLTFENNPNTNQPWANGTALFNQYSGLIFVGGDTCCIKIVQPTTGTISGQNAVESNFPGEFTGTGIGLRFSQGQRRVKLTTGLVIPSTCGPIAAIMKGYSDEAAQVEITSTALVPLGTAAGPINVPLEIRSSTGEIRFAGVRYICLNDPFMYGPVNFPLVIDNLEYEEPTVPPPPDTTAPVISITHPGGTAEGTVPGLIETYINGTVEEEALKSLTFSLNDAAPVPLIYWNRVPSGYSFLLNPVRDSQGLREGFNTLVVTATDFDGNVGTQTRTFIYHGAIVLPPSDVDITPIAVEVSQGIDSGPVVLTQKSSDGEGYSIEFPPWGLPLIQGKETLVRIYAIAQRANAIVPGVPIDVTVNRADCEENCRVGYLQTLVDRDTPVGAISVLPAGTPDADPDVLSRDLANSWNFLIPADWSTQDLHIIAHVNLGGRSAPECVAEFLGECERDNKVEIRLSFQPPKVATVMPVLVHMTGTLGSDTIDETPTMTDVSQLLKDLNTQYPTKFELGPILSMEADANINKSDLLDAVQSRFDGNCDDGFFHACLGPNPDTFVVALVTDEFNLEAGGLANQGNRAVWATTESERLNAVHEVGHAIGFNHASCDHNEADGGGCDRYFPIEHGGIGGLGFDFNRWELKKPRTFDEHTDVNTSSFPHDFMSHGENPWVSTYTWIITSDRAFVGSVDYETCWTILPPDVYNCGVSQSLSAPPSVSQGTPSYLVSGRIAADGHAVVRDAIELPFSISTTDLELGNQPDTYRLAALDEAGNTIAIKDFRADPYSDADGAEDEWKAAFRVYLDKPSGAAIKRIDVTDGVNTLGSTVARTAGAPFVEITSPVAGELWSRGETRQVAWIINGGDSGAYSSRVEYITGDDTPGRIIGSNIEDQTLNVNVNDLPASDHARIIVRVSNGIDTGVATSEPFVVEQASPTVVIVRPTKDVVVEQGLPVSLFGLGTDDQNPLEEAALEWSSDLDGGLGAGSILTVSSLQPGKHHITLKGTAPNGKTGAASVRVVVIAPPDSNGMCGTGLCGSGSGMLMAVGLLGIGGMKRRVRRTVRCC